MFADLQFASHFIHLPSVLHQPHPDKTNCAHALDPCPHPIPCLFTLETRLGTTEVEEDSTNRKVL